MSFNAENVTIVSRDAGDSPDVYTYCSTTDTIAEITAAGYFGDNRRGVRFGRGDVIHISAVDSVSSIVFGEDGGIASSTSSIENLPAPRGFTNSAFPPSLIAERVGNSYSCSLTPESFIDFDSDFSVKMYADFEAADNGGDGLSWANAKKAIGACIDVAIASATDTIIFVKAGVYPRFSSFMNVGSEKTLTCNIAVVAVGGRVQAGPFETLTWSTLSNDGAWSSQTGAASAGDVYTNNNETWVLLVNLADITSSEPSASNSDWQIASAVYQTSRSNAQQVLNPQFKQPDGSYYRYAAVASLADCAAQGGSWYTDDSITYVNTLNGVPATDLNARTFLAARNFSYQGAFKVYLYGIDFEGGSSGAIDPEDATTVASKCSFKYALSGDQAGTLVAVDGVVSEGGLFVAFDSEASNNSKDGFNIHDSGVGVGHSLTVNCSGFKNGQIVDGTASCNGLTNHDGGTSIDIGGVYLGSLGANVAIVNDNTEVWCFGTIAGNSGGDYDTISTGGFSAGSGSALYLENCTDEGTSVGLNSGGVIYIRNYSGTGDRVGTIESFNR